MPSQLASFTDRCVDLSYNAAIGKPAPTINKDDGGYTDWVIVSIHCLREYLNQPYRRLLDIPEIVAKLDLSVDQPPYITPLYAETRLA